MSTITLPTRFLVRLLEDASLTTLDPKNELPHLSAVLLHTDRSSWAFEVEGAKDDDGGPLFDDATSDLLIGTSTMVSMVAQTHVPCTGQLHRSILIAEQDCASVISVFKPLVTTRLPKTVTHQTVITYTGETVIISEDPHQVPRAKSLTVSAMDLDPFPRNIADLLETDPSKPVLVDGKEIPASYGTGWEGIHLEVLGKVAKRRKAPLRVYRHHQKAPMVAEIGRAYRAVLQPWPLKDENDEYTESSIEVFGPDLPPRKEADTTQPLVPAGASTDA